MKLTEVLKSLPMVAAILLICSSLNECSVQ